MSGSLTVIGGHSASQGLTGLVTVPAGFSGSVLTNLQSLLTAASGAVSTDAANFENLNVAGLTGAISATVGSFHTGVLDVSNTDSVNATTAGSANILLTVPGGYDTLVVQAPGNETVQGNGGTFLAVFGSDSHVDYNAAGGSGTVYASGNDTTALNGSTSYFIGGSGGHNFVEASGTNASITLVGAANTLLTDASNSTVQSGGSSDVIVTANPNAQSFLTVTGNATLRNDGAADTVVASGSGRVIGYFEGSAGGDMDFINSSTGASSIIASLNPITGAISSQGSVTVHAGTGGGIYDGGISGNNSLIGGSGAVTLFSAGVNNYLYTDGDATGSAYNLLNSFSGGNDTLIAGSGSTNNVFFAGIGTESIQSTGSGKQTYFVGIEGSDTINASTVAGATNTFIFQQAASQGGGTDTLLNFRPGEGFINENNSVTGVKITSVEELSGAETGSQIDLSNGTTIKIIGVNPSSFNGSIVGGTRF